MIINGRRIRFFINVKNTRAHYVDLLLAWVKKEETRSLAAYNRMAKHLRAGDLIGIVSDGMVVGYMVYDGVRFYATRGEFDRARGLHCVPAGSEYDYDDRKQKVGLLLSHPVRLDHPVAAPSSPWRGYRVDFNEV